MSRAECGAAQNDADTGSAEPPLEPAQHERALNFFAHAAGDDDDDAEERGAPARADQVLQGILGHVVQPRRIHQNRRKHDNRDAERDENHRDAGERFRKRTPSAEE